MKEKFNYKTIMAPICAVIALVILFVMLHLVLIGPLPLTSIRIDGWNTRIVTKEEIDAGLRDFSYYGNYIKSESTNPWINLAGINEDHNMRYLYIDIEDISENNSTLDLFLIKDDDFIRNYYTLYQGVNIVCLEWNAFDSARIDLTSKYGVFFWINEIKFTDNYFLAIPVWFWVVYLLAAAALIIILVLFITEKNPNAVDNKTKSVYWAEYGGGVLSALKEHKIAFIIGGIIVILIFGYEITNFTLSVDEPREIVHAVGTIENIDSFNLREGQGRYSTTLLKHIISTDGAFTPYVDTLIAVLGIISASIINIISFEKCCGKRFKAVSCIIFMGMFCSLPYVVTEWMCFSTINAELSIGIFLMSLSIYAVCVHVFSDNRVSDSREKIAVGERYGWLIYSSLLCAFNIAIYESLAPYFMINAVFCVLFYVIYDEEAGFKKFFIKAVPFIISFIIGFGIYGFVRIIIGTNGYTDKFVQWGKTDTGEILKSFISFLDSIFNTVIPGSVLSSVSILCFALMLLMIGIRQKRAERFFLILFCGLCCFISTFSLNIVVGGITKIRALIPLMMLTSAPWIIIIEYLASYKFLKEFSVVLSAFILLHQAVYVNKLFTGANLAYWLDVEWGYEMGTRIVSLCPDSYSAKPLVIVGRHYHESPVITQIDVVGQPISYRGGGETIFLLRYLGFEFVQSDYLDKEKLAQANDLAADMPIYPAEGSIYENDDMIIVRLS